MGVVKVHKYRLTFKYSCEISEDSVLPCGLVRDGAAYKTTSKAASCTPPASP